MNIIHDKVEQIDNPSAPYIYFDTITASGYIDGVLQIKTGAKNVVRSDNEVRITVNQTSNLRMTARAARELHRILGQFVEENDAAPATTQ